MAPFLICPALTFLLFQSILTPLNLSCFLLNTKIQNTNETQMATTIHDILEEFRQDAIHMRDLGDKFERLIANYLIIDPLYQDKYSDVWLWQEWPGRGNQPDTGIDLVAKERYTGEFCAIG